MLNKHVVHFTHATLSATPRGRQSHCFRAVKGPKVSAPSEGSVSKSGALAT